MCQFSHLTVGENATLFAAGLHCRGCNRALPDYSGPAIYLGHTNLGEGKMDIFKITGRLVCAKCEMKVTDYVEHCDDGGAVWQFSTVEVDKESEAQ